MYQELAFVFRDVLPDHCQYGGDRFHLARPTGREDASEPGVVEPTEISEQTVQRIAFGVVAAFRRHSHINNVLTHISGSNWDSVERALRTILGRSAKASDLPPLATKYPDFGLRRAWRHRPDSQALFLRRSQSDVVCAGGGTIDRAREEFSLRSTALGGSQTKLDSHGADGGRPPNDRSRPAKRQCEAARQRLRQHRCRRHLPPGLRGGQHAKIFWPQHEIGESVAIERRGKCVERLMNDTLEATTSSYDALTAGRKAFDESKIWLGRAHNIAKADLLGEVAEINPPDLPRTAFRKPARVKTVAIFIRWFRDIPNTTAASSIVICRF